MFDLHKFVNDFKLQLVGANKYKAMMDGYQAFMYQNEKKMTAEKTCSMLYKDLKYENGKPQCIGINIFHIN